MHVESHEYAGTGGSGAPLVLIHGWGMHGGIWDNVVPQLAQRFRVHCVDLPGYGHSKLASPMSGIGRFDENPLPQPLPMNLKLDVGRKSVAPSAEWDSYGGRRYAFPPYMPPGLNSDEKIGDCGLSSKRERGVELLDEIAEQLSVQFDEPLMVCGWSLGGQVTLRWAQLHPAQVKKIVLVASTPCFAERDDWLFGMAQATLQQFAAELERDYVATLRRFLALQVRGSENERDLLLTLRECLFSRGKPDMAALRGGLEILRDADLRAELPAIRQPALVIAGERDKLTPPEASFYLAQTLPDARVVEIAGAAHTPFLSHPQIFLQHLNEFLA